MRKFYFILFSYFSIRNRDVLTFTCYSAGPYIYMWIMATSLLIVPLCRCRVHQSKEAMERAFFSYRFTEWVKKRRSRQFDCSPIDLYIWYTHIFLLCFIFFISSLFKNNYHQLIRIKLSYTTIWLPSGRVPGSSIILIFSFKPFCEYLANYSRATIIYMEKCSLDIGSSTVLVCPMFSNLSLHTISKLLHISASLHPWSITLLL